MVILRGRVRWTNLMQLLHLFIFADIIIFFSYSTKSYCIDHQKFFRCFRRKIVSRRKLCFLEMIFITSHTKHRFRFLIVRIFFSNLSHFLWKEIEQIEKKDSEMFQIKSSLNMSNISQRLIFCELRHFICHITHDLKRRFIPYEKK